MSIFEDVTNVYVRVDANSRKVIGVSPVKLVTREGRPVFNVVANFKRLDYYVVETNASATYGFTVRAATSAERTAADAALAARNAASLLRAKSEKAIVIKNFYDEAFISRFYARGFYTTLETLAAADYDGTDEHMLTNVQPKAKKINKAYNEWRHTVCQPVIEAMLADEGLGADLDDDYRTATQDQLDAFLTARDFDVTVYARR